MLRVNFVFARGKVEAFFELPGTYPFSLMDVELDVSEGDIDVDDIKANIVKTAKPGYGYLIRVCDVIAASVL